MQDSIGKTENKGRPLFFSTRRIDIKFIRPVSCYTFPMNTQAYHWNAEDYAKSSSAQLQWAQELIGKLYLSGNESILDIGCGDGKVTANLAQAVPAGRVVGIDRSHAMVSLAYRQYVGRFPRLSFVQMDAVRMGFCGMFDTIFSNATLHWVSNHLSVLDGAARALKPGGKLLFQMGGRGNAAGIIDAIDSLLEKTRWNFFFQNFQFPYTFLGPEDYEPMLRKVGLRAKRIELIPKDMQQMGKDGLSSWLRTTWMPYLERVNENERQDFLEDLVDTYLLHQPADENKIIHVQMVRLEVEAVKP